MAVLLISILLITTSLYQITAQQKTQVINTTTGKVQGFVLPSIAIPNKSVQVFWNIPYAEAPVGILRFAKPEPRKPWNGTLNSTRAAVCWQQYLPNIQFTEDCLILNIWTPHPQPKNASVMIWIHGGSFRSGTSGVYDGRNFVPAGDVILVTINYRLSALGFLSTGDDRIKGNFGLFDQRLAMKWVRDNIASFGGNNQSITIFGESAGAACVSAHTVSEKSWPYFDRVILQSGTITAPWAIVTPSFRKAALSLFLENVNCTDDVHLLECLRNNVTDQDLEKIYRSQPFVLESARMIPYIDGDFFTDNPKKLLNEGKIKNADVILGVTKDEGFYFEQDLLQQSRNITTLTQIFHEKLKNQVNVLEQVLRKNWTDAVYNEAVKLYQAECTPSFIEAFKPTVAFETDFYFVCDTANEAIVRSKIQNSTNTFLYQFSFASSLPTQELYTNGEFGFAAHGADVRVTFGQPINDYNFPAEDQILSMRMILYWTNFAKYGDPSLGQTKLPITINEINDLPKWPKFTYSERKYLNMESLSRMIIGKRLRETYCDFWKDPEGFTERATKSTPQQPLPTTSTKRQQTTSSAVKHIAQVALLSLAMLTAIL